MAKPITNKFRSNSPVGETPPVVPPKFPDQTDKEKLVIKQTFEQFRVSATDRNRIFQNFDGLNLIQYIEDSYRRYNTNIDVRDDIEDWQAAVHDPFTRNKVNAILGQISTLLPIAEIRGRGDEDIRKGVIMSSLYEYSEDVDDYEEFLVTLLNEAIVKGTAIGYEGQEFKKEAVRNVKGSGDDMTVSEGSITTNRLFAQVVKLEDFYPSSVGVRHIKGMPRCFWRNVISYQQFDMDFSSSYKKCKYVEPYKSNWVDGETRPYYFDYISSDVRDGEVEIIRKYDKQNDQYIIVANGVWLNPLIVKGGIEEVQPLPFNHKELPFYDIKFELYGSDFFYGKSLPDKLKNYQDVLNVLTNMLLDQSFLTVFKPIITNGFDSIEDDYLRPGRRTPIDTQGLPIRDAMMPLDMGTPSGWHQYILEYTRKIMEESSMDKVTSGIAGQGDRTTAKEISVAAEGVTAMLGLFGRWAKYGIKRKALLRTKNIAQFWMDATSPMTAEILGNDTAGEAKKYFNVVKMNDAVLSGGKRGVKVIEMYKSNDEMPTKGELKNKADMYELSNNSKIEYVAMNVDYLRNLDFDIKLVPSQKNDINKELEKSMQLEKVRVYLSFFPDMVDKAELLTQTAIKMGDDPAKIIMDSVLNPQPTPAPGEPGGMGAKPMQTTPQGNVAHQQAQQIVPQSNIKTILNNSLLG